MRPSVIGWLTGVTDATLSVTGRAQAYPGVLSYKLHPGEPGQPRVTVATPTFPGTIRGVSLDLSRYRIDSGRLLGMTLLREALKGAVKQLNVKGGATWAAERLIGRVRYLAKNYGFDVKLTEELDKLDALLKPLAGGWINEGPFLGVERFSVQSLLDDVTKLRAAGETALDPWWSRLGWDDDTLMVEDDVYRAVLDEEYRRIQKVYAEIVEASFPNLAGEAIYFPILPIRWKLTVVRRDRREGPSTIGFHWIPVESWHNAGADVSFADELPGGIPDFEAVRAALTKLGRPAARLPGLMGWTRQQQYDGSTLHGHFDGMSPVVSTVCSWLNDDLKHLFEGLPTSDGSF